MLSIPGTVTDASPNGVGSGTPTLITAGPVLALAERWQVELTVLRHRSPGSDAVTTLADCVDELLKAIEAGRDICLHLTIAEAHAVSNMPISTLRWLCTHRSEEIGAQKREGVWYIDRTRFTSYLRAKTTGPQAITEVA